MARLLLLYSTVDGHTRKIGRRLKEVLERGGHAAQLIELRGKPDVDLAAFDTIVIGASIRYGRHRRDVHDFVATHRPALERMPCAFFSVNLVARKPGRAAPATNPYLRTFVRRTGWTPRAQAAFAGRLDYAAYGRVDRWIIRLIMWMTGGPTDPKACVEFTDWGAVDAFARRVAGL